MGILRRSIGLLLIVISGYALYTIIPDLLLAIVSSQLNSTLVGTIANTAFVTFGVLPERPELIFIDVAIYALVLFIGFILLLKGDRQKIRPPLR